MQFRLASAPLAWALVVISLQMAVVVRIYIWRLERIHYWESFDAAIRSAFFLILLNVTAHVIASWSATPAIAKSINRWKIFHGYLEATARKPMSSIPLKVSYIGNVIILAQLVLLLFIPGEGNIESFSTVKDAVYSLCVFYVNLVVLYWAVFCLLVKYVADLLRESLIKATAKSQPVMAEVLRAHRALWLELHGCTLELIGATGRTVQLWQVTNLIYLILSSYATLMCLLVDTCEGSGYIFIAFIHHNIYAFFMFTFSHFAQKSMKADFLSCVYSRRWRHLSESATTELNLLLDAVEMAKPCFVINGLFAYDRQGFLSILYTIMTYLVVTLQLKTAAEEAT